MIMLDMEMPDSCRECWLCKFNNYNGDTECAVERMILARHYKALDFEGRAEECPLKEIKNGSND